MREYIEDKPADCRYCYFGDVDDPHCAYDANDNECYYSLTEQSNIKLSIKNECANCPYGLHSPCIGWCTREILRSIRKGSRNEI